jgi:protein TonB
MALLSSDDPRLYAVGSRRWYTLPLSIFAHASVLVAVCAVPLLATDVWFPTPAKLVIFVPVKPLPPAPPPSSVVRVAADRAVPVDSHETPTAASDQPAVEPPAPVALLGPVSARPWSPDGVGTTAQIAPPPPVAPAKPAGPLPLGGQIVPPRKINDIAPVYPAAARAARVTGVVLVEAIIGVDGRVRDARVLRSNPLLDRAALDAVRDWRYTPARLNGEPVEVFLTVAVSFAME